jgi:twinkle protein
MKDPNDFLIAGRVSDFNKAIRSASKLLPDGVISSFQDVEKAMSVGTRKAQVTVPFKELQTKLEGLAFGESVLVSGREGIGKTEIFRKLQHHILSTTDFNVGIIHIEEKKDATIHNLLSYELEVPLKRASVELTLEDRMKAYKGLVRRENRNYIYNHYGSDHADTILGIIRYLVAVCGCKFIFFDHINIAVSGLNDNSDERRTLDYICTKLNTMVAELDFCLLTICHITDAGETRGSRNMGQAFHTHIRLSRDIKAADPFVRSKLVFDVIKNRPVGPSGPAGYGVYNEETGCLVDGSTYEKEVLPQLPTPQEGQHDNVPSSSNYDADVPSSRPTASANPASDRNEFNF